MNARWVPKMLVQTRITFTFLTFSKFPNHRDKEGMQKGGRWDTPVPYGYS
jgi:hypothetical protein